MTDADQRLAEIRERAEKATPGPWEMVDQHGQDTHWIDVIAAEPLPSAVGLGNDEVCNATPELNRHLVHKSFLGRHDEHIAQIHVDLDFIAHARTDIPWLLDCHDADQAEIASLRKAAAVALEHVMELRDAWERGCITEHDGLGGTRSNRNVDVRVSLRAALSLLPEAGKPTTDETWLRDKASKEDGCIVSVGGLVTDIEALEAGNVPCLYCHKPKSEHHDGKCGGLLSSCYYPLQTGEPTAIDSAVDAVVKAWDAATQESGQPWMQTVPTEVFDALDTLCSLRLEAGKPVVNADTARCDWLRKLLSKQIAIQFLSGPDVARIEIVDENGKETAFEGTVFDEAIDAAMKDSATSEDATGQ